MLQSPWVQMYDPCGNVFLSALVAALPIFVLLGLLAFFHVRAHVAAMAGLLVSLAVSVLIFKMPISLALTAAANGAAYGLFPIGWIVLSAMFVYDISVSTGQFEVLKRSIASIAEDRRLQVLLIAFCFGAFIEGAAGFGTPVAISAAMLIGLGFKPLPAAGLALIGNTAPVAFGALGTPMIVLNQVTDLPIEQLSMMVGRQLPLFSLIIPFWLIWAMAGWRSMWEVWPGCLTAGLSFGILQYAVSNFHGPWLVDVISAIGSIIALTLLLRFWKPATVWRFPHEIEQQSTESQHPNMPPTTRESMVAWMPWVVLSCLVFLWGIPQMKSQLNAWTRTEFEVPLLHLAVIDAQSIVVASIATGQHGQEGTILRYVFFHSVALAILVGLLVTAQAYVVPQMIPILPN